ncbi:MAG: ABC transporter permease subunit [Gemmatimonadales bacterium]|jgi:ABC-type transport system involved in multi-copper enzyme maturation permease subunit
MSAAAVSPVWAVVFRREMRDLWIGGKALILVLLHTVLLGGYSFLLASNAEVNLLPRVEMISEIVKATITVGLFICLIIGADAISGERERGTLEGILLTPASRRQFLVGKLLAALSPWPVALAISIPYWMVLSKGDPVFWTALLWGSVLGTLLAPAVAGLGMLVSVWCNSNKSSMLASLGIYLLLLLPTEIARPGVTQTANELQRAAVYQWTNPWHGASEFLGRMIMFGASPSEFGHLLTLPVIFPFLVIALLLVFASRGLRLDPGTARKVKLAWNRLRAFLPVPAARQATAGAEMRPRVGTPRDTFVPPTEGWQMMEKSQPNEPRDERAASASTGWWVICRKELRDLWIGGKALNMIIAYTIMMGVYTYLMARGSAASVEPPKELVFELLKAALMFEVFMGVVIGADSLSGERDRATLEGLLLTPVRRRQIVFGKFLAAISPWPVALAITVPYFNLLAQGDEVFGQAVLWGGLFGTALILGFAALGMLVSFWCNTNKSSLFLSLGIYLLFLLPTQLTGRAQGGFMGLLFQGLNPMAGPRHFLATILVNNRTPGEMWPFGVSAFLFAVLVPAVLFLYAGPALRLEAGRVRKSLRPQTGAVAVFLACCMGLLGTAGVAELQAQPSQSERSAVMQTPLEVSITMTDTTVRAGGAVLFDTEVTNGAMQASPPLIVAMNIINLDSEGDVVDPEDWSPERTQYVQQLAAGESATLSWRVNAILDGDYMVYMVVIPSPGVVDETSQPVASSGIHLTVTPYTKLNPGGVLPYVIGGPLLLGLIIFLVYRHRRRQIDVGAG